MPKQKTIPELEAEIAPRSASLPSSNTDSSSLKTGRSYYEKGNRRKRAHRLITRGAAIESVEPPGKGFD